MTFLAHPPLVYNLYSTNKLTKDTEWEGSNNFDFTGFNKEYQGKSCWVAGWGKTNFNNRNVNEQLLSVGLNFMSIQYCRDHRNDYFLCSMESSVEGFLQ